MKQKEIKKFNKPLFRFFEAFSLLADKKGVLLKDFSEILRDDFLEKKYRYTPKLRNVARENGFELIGIGLYRVAFKVTYRGSEYVLKVAPSSVANRVEKDDYKRLTKKQKQLVCGPKYWWNHKELGTVLLAPIARPTRVELDIEQVIKKGVLKLPYGTKENIKRIQDMYNITQDLHSDNIGWRDGLPWLIDLY